MICKIFHTSAKLTASDSNVQEAFISMHQGILKTIRNYADADWVVLDPIMKHGIKIFEC